MAKQSVTTLKRSDKTTEKTKTCFSTEEVVNCRNPELPESNTAQGTETADDKNVEHSSKMWSTSQTLTRLNRNAIVNFDAATSNASISSENIVKTSFL